MKKTKTTMKTIIFTILLSALCFSWVQPVLAAKITDQMLGALNAVALPTGGVNPDETAINIVGGLINGVLSFIGIFLMILIIYGGFIWLNAKGKEEEIDKAKNILRAAIIGFIIIMLAYAISSTITFMLEQKIVLSS
jgi:cytochrome bd-type quinol oxidase subunit 2